MVIDSVSKKKKDHERRENKFLKIRYLFQNFYSSNL